MVTFLALDSSTGKLQLQKSENSGKKWQKRRVSWEDSQRVALRGNELISALLELEQQID